MRRMKFLLLLFCRLFVVLNAWDVSIVIEREASHSRGGERFEIQPLLSIWNKKQTRKHENILGRIVATLHHDSFPSEFIGVVEGDECKVEEYRDGVSLDVLSGSVEFVNLCVNRAGGDYSIMFSLFDEFDIELGSVIQQGFTVETGEPFQIGVIESPSIVNGHEWSVNPVVAVQDRGRNTVNLINDGNVVISLAPNPYSEILDMKVMSEVELDASHIILSPTSKPWVNGIAEFEGVSVKKAGVGYQLQFTTDIELPVISCLSKSFDVFAGNAHGLKIIEEPYMSNVYGGKVFLNQPLLHVVDAGGNIVEESDSDSVVIAELFHNPTHAIVEPRNGTTVKVKDGIAQFENLFIAKAGKGYMFRYSLHEFAPQTFQQRMNPNITVHGTMFDVQTGQVESLKLLQESGSTWSGNQPFVKQPKLALVDSGGNILYNTTNIAIESSMTESLSSISDIMIDTRNDNLPRVVDIRFSSSIINDGFTSYSNGHVVLIEVRFDEEVYIRLKSDQVSHSNLRMPSLQLNVTNSGGFPSHAYLIESIELDRPYEELIYEYMVDVDHEQSNVDIFETDPMKSNDYEIVDGWGRKVLLEISTAVARLPLSKKINVHDKAAEIVDVRSEVLGGTYSAGHEIDIIVEFSHKVSVEGSPQLRLDIFSTVVIIETESLGTSLSTSYFYIWYKGKKSRSIAWDASALNVKDAIEQLTQGNSPVCVSRNKSTLAGNRMSYRWALRLEGLHDVLETKTFWVEPATVVRDHKSISLQVSFLRVSAPLSNWQLDDDMSEMCTVRIADYITGTGTNQISFRYIVLQGDYSPELQILQPFPISKKSGREEISNAINDGSKSNIIALLQWNGVVNFGVGITTQKPKITNVMASSNKEFTQVFRAGDKLSFIVDFDSSVEISSDLLLGLNSVRSNGAKAVFHSQPLPNRGIFEYTVQSGEWAEKLNLKDSKVIAFMNTKWNSVLNQSSRPITSAELVLEETLLNNLPIIDIDARRPRIVDVQLTFDTDKDVLIKDDEVFVDVVFSSPVVLKFGPPVLVVNFGSGRDEAPYIMGDKTANLRFRYKIQLGDSSEFQPVIAMICPSNGCIEGCSNEGYILQDSDFPVLEADLSMSNLIDKDNAVLKLPHINIDTTSSAVTDIISLKILKEMASVNVGEVIRIKMTFSDKVYIEGRPELALNIDTAAKYESGSGTDEIIFALQTTESDAVNQLDWIADTDSLSAVSCVSNYYNTCSVVNRIGVPVDLSFITNTSERRFDSLEPAIEIVDSVLHIIEVYAVSSLSNLLTAGDVISIAIKYDREVTVHGTPKFPLKLGEKSVYAVYTKHLSTDEILVFQYSVLVGDFTGSSHLSYNSEELVLDESSYIRSKSTIPLVSADLKLPPPTLYPLLTSNLDQIFVEAEVQPSVQRVLYGNETRLYAPGDNIHILVEFDHFVAVEGTPVLLIDVGNGKVGCGYYHTGTTTKVLSFRYSVGIDHVEKYLRYLNSHSLQVSSHYKCGNIQGSIKRQSTNPTIKADVTLPMPGEINSLVDEHFLIDSTAPYVTRIWSPQSPAMFNTTETISILVEFSRLVKVSGSPRLKLETGMQDRFAEFVSIHNDSTLEFQYKVRLGDFTQDLDYWTNEVIVRSSSMDLQEGSIMVPSSNPILHADVHINPSFGTLSGLDTELSFIEGEVDFRGLKMGKRGNYYKVHFGTNIEGIQYDANMNVKVDASAEYELNGDESDRDFGDAFGFSVAIRGDMVAVGAPKKKMPSSEIQVVKIWSESISVEREIQIVSTQVDVDQSIRAVQSFSTFTSASATVSGSFSISYNDPDSNYKYASSLELSSTCDSTYMKQRLMEMFPVLGNLDVSRTSNDACDCENAWTWKVTFHDASRGFGTLMTDGTNLDGHITDADFDLYTDMLRGTFKLRNPFNNLTSRNIQYDSSAMDMKAIIEKDLDILVTNVRVANTNRRDIPDLGRRWIITFDSHVGEFGRDVNVPNLIAEASTLLGKNATVWTYVGTEGKSPLSGSLSFSFRGSNYSNFISYDADVDEVKEALENLDSINKVSVIEKETFEIVSGYQWTIVFESVNKLTNYGWLPDPGGESTHGNLERLEITSHLVGWNVQTHVDYVHGSDISDTQSQWMAKEMGNDGAGSGQISIYSKSNAGWDLESHLEAPDRDAHDNFGFSVGLGQDFVVVGSPFKEITGVPEQQRVICKKNALHGHFRFRFRGFYSNSIAYNATISEIQDAMQGIYKNTNKLHSLPKIVITSEGEWAKNHGGFCVQNENNFTVTFTTPDGGGVSTEMNVTGDIELMQLVFDHDEDINDPPLEIIEWRRGTKSLSGSTSLGSQSGAVYTFTRDKTCSHCPVEWKFEQKISLLDCPYNADLIGSEHFGWSVAIQNDTIFVGAPGATNSTGEVYTFVQNSKRVWEFRHRLTAQVWQGKEGDRFGSTIAVNSNDTIIIGAPMHNNGQGSVYTFRRHPTTSQILSSQQLLPSLSNSTVKMSFGHSLSIWNNEAVICSPNQEWNGLESSGACFIYHRATNQDYFQKIMVLEPTNVNKYDRFGWSVSMHRDKILVGQVEEYRGVLDPQTPVQAITLSCQNCTQTIDGYFELSWRNNHIRSKPLSPSVSANQLRQILECQLNTGPVRVTRSENGDKHGGYKWLVTFTAFGRDSNQIPKLGCDVRYISADNPTCHVEILSNMPQNIRSKTHIFVKDKDNSWTEEAFLLPALSQAQDLVGSSVAVQGDYAVVGAPNRDLLNINSGAAIVYDLDFLNFQFESDLYNVTEGESLHIKLERKQESNGKVIGVKTFSTDEALQLKHFTDHSKTLQYPRVGSAVSNPQYYGGIDNRSQWIFGMRDFRGLNDYQALDYQMVVKSNKESITIDTTDDDIFEGPSESMVLQVAMPGMFSSPEGHLRTKIMVVDDGDGVVNNTVYYSKKENPSSQRSSSFGMAIGGLEEDNFVLVGDSTFNENSGIVYLYKLEDGKWKELTSISSPSNESIGSMFGDEVLIKPSSNGKVEIVIGEPNLSKVHVYTYEKHSNITDYICALSIPSNKPPTSELKFGIRGSIAMEGDLILVSSSQMESVYLYRRKQVLNLEQGWEFWTTIRSSDYDYDLYDDGFTVKHMHKQGFGTRVAMNERSILVSAIYANYGNRGDNSEREHFDTNGIDNVGLGKGKVYIFYSRPHVFTISCMTSDEPVEGNLRLTILDRSAVVGWNDTEEIINEMSKTHFPFKLSMKRNKDQFKDGQGIVRTWTVTLDDYFSDELPSVSIAWNGSGCDECIEFVGQDSGSINNLEINVEHTYTMSSFEQVHVLESPDLTSGDCFGCSLDIDSDQIVVGAPHSSAKTRTTWDFETGNLVGWFITGNAFDFQPTFGDNARKRMTYSGFGKDASFTSGDPQPSKPQGRYYIGTYEKRPGTRGNFLVPDSTYSEGNIQGDAPKGTITSDPFMINGEEISFLIGGGCDPKTEYIELLVDGFSTVRSTGLCSEKMELNTWDVSMHKGRSGQIRIVDDSSELWGHINIDSIKFSWNKLQEKGGAVQGYGSSNGKQHYHGQEETPLSGAAYIFKRICPNESILINGCQWVEEQRLVPSDKRAGNNFGASVVVNSINKNILVGSNKSPSYGFYKEDPQKLYRFPVQEASKDLNFLDHIPLATSFDVPIILPQMYTENAGAIYTFSSRDDAWSISEHARIAPPDVKGNELFASNLFFWQNAVIAGSASGHSFYFFNLLWQSLHFAQSIYIVSEDQSEIEIEVIREYSEVPLQIGYSTSDLTATGVAKEKVMQCKTLPLGSREGCGDYMQTTGILHFEAKQIAASFTVQIIDDDCLEKELEYIQLTLHIPGAAAIQGESFRAQIHIADDDFLSQTCTSEIS